MVKNAVCGLKTGSNNSGVKQYLGEKQKLNRVHIITEATGTPQTIK